MTLNVDGDRIHGDVGGCDLHVHGESGGIPAESLGTDAEAVDGVDELFFQARAFGVIASASQDPSSACPSSGPTSSPG